MKKYHQNVWLISPVKLLKKVTVVIPNPYENRGIVRLYNRWFEVKQVTAIGSGLWQQILTLDEMEPVLMYHVVVVNFRVWKTGGIECIHFSSPNMYTCLRVLRRLNRKFQTSYTDKVADIRQYVRGKEVQFTGEEGR